MSIQAFNRRDHSLVTATIIFVEDSDDTLPVKWLEKLRGRVQDGVKHGIGEDDIHVGLLLLDLIEFLGFDWSAFSQSRRARIQSYPHKIVQLTESMGYPPATHHNRKFAPSNKQGRLRSPQACTSQIDRSISRDHSSTS